MENLIPIKVEVDLPLDNLQKFVKTLKNSVFETKQEFAEKPNGLVIDKNGDLFSCELTKHKGEEVVFQEDKQEQIFWIEDETETNCSKEFVPKQKINFSGHLSFWTTLKSIQKGDISVLYRAVFLDGNMVHVELVDWNILTVQDKRNKHFIEKKILLFLGKFVHNLSFFLLQTIYNRLSKISS